MKLPDERFADGFAGLDEILNKAERIPVSGRFKMILEGLLADCHPCKHHRRFAERERISLDGVGRIGIIDKECVAQLFALAVCERTLGGKPILEHINLLDDSAHGRRNAQSAHRPAIARFLGGSWNLPKLPAAYRAGNLPVFAQNTHPPVGYSPPARSLLA